MQPPLLFSRLVAPTLAILGLLLLVGCAGGGGKKADLSEQPTWASSSTFPVPPELRDNVDFWRHVYGIWGRGQVAFHDNKHLGVIYEVAELPGPVGNGAYSKRQRAWVNMRTDDYAARLKVLERNLAEGRPLSSDQKQLLAKFDRAGGRAALIGAEQRVRGQRGLRERFRAGIEISGRYDAVFRDIMRRNGVPEDLAYLPHVESSFQTHARSKVGAGGVWQFMPATARQYMTLNSAVDERFDPILAADGAARYLSQAYRKLGSWPLAITSYNHGQGGMAKAKAIYGDDIGRIATRYNGRAFGFASRNFYSEFVAAREVASNPERYFPEGVQYEQPWNHDRLVLRYPLPASHIARHYGTSTARLSGLNLHWNQHVRAGDKSLPAGSTVWLPGGSLQRVASQPPPMPKPVVIAKTEPKAHLTLAKSEKPAAEDRSAAKPKPKASATRYHVVQPEETLYRVALSNGISVTELRRLNKMRPGDSTIRPGQRLKVGI
ncbi:MAG: transglycosylase SLT domain-containing protein [Thiohalocapsa sp. PB-PSB1]|jgi:membrane-bound lytic murein transglycosylase D|nr:MAG: hypothetical protein N838_20435 [Thiohalocapsa sp. PB-PSB1]QQO56012.1 MAG: transglycosylase SLT domain-containing protein [Thiohalocapsa sp. PB-PSB1]HCS89623.1 lytic transglycosylase [Chromatiaceae bacterium]